MRRYSLLTVVLLAGCAHGAAADLPAVGEARSLTAEWALISKLQSQGRVTDMYARKMREQIRTRLHAIPETLTEKTTVYAAAIQAAAALPESASVQQLDAIADTLKKQEDSLESA